MLKLIPLSFALALSANTAFGFANATPLFPHLTFPPADEQTLPKTPGK